MTDRIEDRTTFTGVVTSTHASANARTKRRQMTVRLDDSDTEVGGSIPAGLREAATTLVGRRVQFTAVLNSRTGGFHHPDDGTILPPAHLDRATTARRRPRPLT